ncbi:MAG: NAD(P)H-hydrate dehydratase [Candidatus Pacebacteria bacterium CG_4_10_14_0_8_um_filter_42_14]|nr:MAG: NAD(P)H-hydrate dehydratase [Candidatus Pacebacteria bacterium CG_4_10_14_0_8_um_filter_42_14]
MNTSISPTIAAYLQRLKLPEKYSHKGQNGKLLIIGGSELFHAASKWSLDVASKFVDMVFYSSVPSNNVLVQAAKQEFWNGLVVERENLADYIDEADCILIGPGMERSEETTKVTNKLLAKYPEKKWVIDAGALQMMSPELIPKNSIITPHAGELERLLGVVARQSLDSPAGPKLNELEPLLAKGTTVLLKGPTDYIYHRNELVTVEGGSPGMTKGGTGDVLAGVVAALFCNHDAMTAAVIGSFANKQAGEELHSKFGPLFNASDLVHAVPKALWDSFKSFKN